MELDQDLLQILKCDLCKGYLSYSPILITSTGLNICGKCNITDNEKTTSTRNLVYENLASIVLFPCAVEGCNDKLSIKNIKKHEESCHNFRCPVKSCEWKHSRDELRKHFEEEHKDLITENPCTYKPELANSETLMLMNAFGFTFTIQIKYNIFNTKMSHIVQLVNDSNVFSLFEYSLLVKGKGGQLEKIKQVLGLDCDINENEIIVNNINGALLMLGDDYEDLQFILEIKMKQKSCFKCEKELDNFPVIENENWICSKCRLDEDGSQDVTESCKGKTCCDLKYCKCNTENLFGEKSSEIKQVINTSDFASTSQSKNSNESNPNNDVFIPSKFEFCSEKTGYHCNSSSCHYTSTNLINIEKHNKWFCNYSKSKCTWGCDKNVRLTNENLFNHYKNTHCLKKNNFSSPSTVNVHEFTISGSAKDWIRKCFTIWNTTYLYRVKLNHNSLNIYIISSMPAEHTSKYMFELMVNDFKNGMTLSDQIIADDWNDSNTHWDFTYNTTGKFQDCLQKQKYILTLKIIKKIGEHCDHTFRCLNIGESLPGRDAYTFCKNTSQGCREIDQSVSNLNKHTKWFCKDQISICEWCNKEIPLRTICLFEHVQKHVVVVDYIDLNGEKNEVFCQNFDLNRWHHCGIQIENLKIFCRFQLRDYSLFVGMISNARVEFIKSFRWKVALTHADTGLLYENELIANTWDNSNSSWDYSFTININFDSCIYVHNKYDIRFIPTKVCSNC